MAWETTDAPHSERNVLLYSEYIHQDGYRYFIKLKVYFKLLLGIVCAENP